ncbi:MAG TPA: DoxX family protein [Anaerolineales bacterium]|nr:DoxX family protein [Anaerolineales bacterium]
MNIALWIAQGLLAVMYLAVGNMKMFQPAKVRENPQMTWAHGQPDHYIRFVGTAEVLGALGLILPLVTRILPWLTVLAGIGLTLIQLLAIFKEHLPKKEYQVIPLNIVLLALSMFVVIGRWTLVSAYV